VVSSWQAGTVYVLTLSVAQRSGNVCGSIGTFGGCRNEDFDVKLDNQVLGRVNATTASYVDVPLTFTTTAGTHTLWFVGVNSLGGDDTAFIDNLRLSAVPTDKTQCKKGGWQTFGVFKNQGDCVSFVATGGKNAAG
jgi:hypothetical protein